MTQPLEDVLNTKIQPALEEAMRKYLGVSSHEVSGDISDRILSSPLLGISIDFDLPYKKAKAKFKKAFMEQLLKMHYGNVSKVARRAGINRRTIHRMLHKKTTRSVRKDLQKPYYLRQQEVESIIVDVLKNYEHSFNSEKMDLLYANTSALSKNITDDLPLEDVSIKDAEKEFDRKYFRHAIGISKGDLKLAAKKMGLAHETLVRKLKDLEKGEEVSS